jgi:ribosomal protein S18 acetylase RimI-like enzyme
MTVIDQARPEERPRALELAYQLTPGEARNLQVIHALQLLDDGVLDPAGIWVARDGTAITGVQICTPLHGASYLFWLPESRGADKDALVQAALAWCRAQGGKLAQAIVPPTDAARAAPLVHQGFRRVTQLLYLEHSLSHLPPIPSSALAFEPFAADNEATFRHTVARSYEGTLDCPELNGVRTIDEILAGYRAAVAGKLAGWWLVRIQCEPAGVLILTELAEDAAWDLSYIGVVPEQRRRGIGRAAICHALATAQAAGAARMLLAVDARNAPARRLYAALGFTQTELRDVYLCML